MKILLGLLFFTVFLYSFQSVSAFDVKWNILDDGISHKEYAIEVQNTENTAKNFDLRLIIQNTSFLPSEVKNVWMYEWKSVNTEFPTYSKRLIEKICYSYDNSTGTNTSYNCPYEETYQNGTEWKMKNQWKPTKMLLVLKPDQSTSDYGLINIPKYDSKAKYDDFGDIETVNGTKGFKVSFDIPIQTLNNGWGSYGEVGILDTLTNSYYHPWWNSTWLYRKSINVTNNVALPEMDYKGNYTINTSALISSGKMQNDCGDIRIVNSTTNSSSKYAIYDCNTTATILTFPVNLSASGTSTDLWIYYGNPSATNGFSAWYSVYYELYDDFNDGDYTNNLTWTVSAGTWTATNGNLTETSLSSNIWLPAIDQNGRNITNGSWEIDMKFNNQICDYRFAMFTNRIGEPGTTSASCYERQLIYIASADIDLKKWVAGTQSAILEPTWTPDTNWHTWKTTINSTTIQIYRDGVSEGSGNPDSNINQAFYIQVRGGAETACTSYNLDNFKVRKFLAREPTYITGTEEKILNDPPESFNLNSKYGTPTNYSTTNTYGFEVTWKDDSDANGYNFSYFENNFTGSLINYTTSRSGNISYYNMTSLPAGTYQFKFYANDSDNKWNASQSTTNYVVSRNSTNIDMYLGGVNNTNTSSNYTASNHNITCMIDISNYPDNAFTLTRNGTSYGTQSGQRIEISQTLKASVYNYTCEHLETQNYTYFSRTQYLTINKASTTLNLTINGTYSNQEYNYCNYTNITAWEENYGLSTSLARNGISISNPYITHLGSSTYSFTAYLNHENYTATNVSRTLIINPILAVVYLYINGTRANHTFENSDVINLTVQLIDPTSGTVNIYRNETLWSTGSSILYNTSSQWNAGLYSVKANFSNANYSSDSETWYIDIFRYSTACNSTEINSKGCGGYNYKYVLTCINDTTINPSGTAKWSNTMDYCVYGCYEGECTAYTPTKLDRCSINQTICGGLNNRYVIPCENETGIYDWSTNVTLWTYCNNTCKNGYCIAFPTGSEYGKCNIGNRQCDKNNIIECRDVNGDGIYEWDYNNKTLCKNGCTQKYYDYGVNATCNEQQSTIFGLSLNMFGDWIGIVGFAFNQIFSDPTSKFFIFMIMSIAFGYYASTKENYHLGILTSIGIIFLGSIVGWVSWYVTVILGTIGFILFMGIGKGEESEGLEQG